MRRFFAALLITVLITAACTRETDPIPITRTRSAVSPTITPSPSAIQTTIAQATTQPSPTPTPLPTATPLPSQTPTRTPRPTLTPKPTATPITHYALPDWVNDPDVPVLLADGLDDRFSNPSISLFNALTGERWDILSNPYYASFAWVVSDGQLFIQLGYSTSSNPDAPGPLRLYISVPDGEISEAPPHPGGTLSNDGRSLVKLKDPDEPGQLILITDYQPGQDLSEGIPLTDPFNGRYNSYRITNWSPDDAYIAISRVAFPENRDGQSLYGLAIYTAEGQLIGAYDGNNGWYWSPVGKPRVLSSLNVGEDHQIPCILDVVTSESRCFNNLESWQRERGVNIYQFRWSPDGSQISFVTYRDPALCIMDIITENVRCLVGAANLMINNGQFYVVGHDWSADGRYLSFFINPQGPQSDDGTTNYLGVVTVEGEDFRILDKTLFTLQTVRLWRPILPELQDE